MISLAIISIALIALLINTTTYLKQSDYLQQKTLAHWIAENQLQRLYIAGSWPPIQQKKTAQVLMAGSHWTWTMQVKATLNPDVRRIEIEVSLEDDVIIAQQGFISQREK